MCAAVKAPGFGDKRDHVGRYFRPHERPTIFEDAGINMDSIQLKGLGRAGRSRVIRKIRSSLEGAGE